MAALGSAHSPSGGALRNKGHAGGKWENGGELTTPHLTTCRPGGYRLTYKGALASPTVRRRESVHVRYKGYWLRKCIGLPRIHILIRGMVCLEAELLCKMLGVNRFREQQTFTWCDKWTCDSDMILYLLKSSTMQEWQQFEKRKKQTTTKTHKQQQQQQPNTRADSSSHTKQCIIYQHYFSTQRCLLWTRQQWRWG